MDYAQIVKNLQIYQRKGHSISFYILKHQHPDAWSNIFGLVQFIFLNFLHKRLFGLILKRITFILCVLPTAFYIYIVSAFLKAKTKMGKNL